MKIAKYPATSTEPGIIFDPLNAALIISGQGEAMGAVEMTSDEMLHIASELIEMSRVADAGEPPLPGTHSIPATNGES